jgi:UDP-N-acetylglucosamine 2-epimerase (non-hydrolysing)
LELGWSDQNGSDLRISRSFDLFDVKVCVTGQHRQMLDQVLTFFDIVPAYDLDVMKTKDSCCGITSACLTGLEEGH